MAGWKAEYAKSGRAKCRRCKGSISMESLRVGKMVQSKQFDGVMPVWHHASCILQKPTLIKSLHDVDGIDSLRWEDQQFITHYITHSQHSPSYAIQLSPSSRSSCASCSRRILKSQVRISSPATGPKPLASHHFNCFLHSNPSVQVHNLPGWDALPDSDKQAVLSFLNNPDNADHHHQPPPPNPTPAAKRKNDGPPHHPSPKVAKTVLHPSDTLETLLELQSTQLWALKDDLKKHVTTAELREMLHSNSQDSSGSELDLRDRCADGMMFGALSTCPMCSGYLHYSSAMYRCSGYLSEWSRCSYSTREPGHIKGKWKIPKQTCNEYLRQWFKSQKSNKPTRVLPPPSSDKSPSAKGESQSSIDESLGSLKVAVVGLPKESIEQWKLQIEGAGGQLHPRIKKETNCVVASNTVDNENAEMRKARRMKLPVVGEEYLVDCFKRQKKLWFDPYKAEAAGEASSMVTVKVKGRSAVHEASGLQDTGHILEDGRSIYNTTLNLSDLSTGANSYYILQIIQEDKGSDCYVYRKWGRVGNDKIGGNKLDQMTKADAIYEFKRLFLEKTGNSWEAWEEKQNFVKKPGKFFPLDIDYGVNKQAVKRSISTADSQLPPPLLELMKMLFDVETYRAAMMEFEINMSEMPLGKLSKSNIQKGFKALTDIQNLLNNSSHDLSTKESLIVDASNRFFTMIPSIHPHVIRDEDDFKSKLKMLEALQDIEIASRLVGFDDDNGDSLDAKYRKLQCHVTPLPHDSDDYLLIKKFLHTTHAPTHTDWSLELEEVFSLEREGEFDKFATYREKLRSRMLLWHGSRLTNFVGILSQGLRIAPPEAPATGYMFGKGIYFADLVSKSAQYCYTDKKNPVGLMVLSEVALGEMYELKKATYMDKPPKGKHSTKGLGKKVPDESGFVKWKNDIIVPCGKPVSSNVRASDLMYNEYIVYDTAQVKMQFLLKVRFHHKR